MPIWQLIVFIFGLLKIKYEVENRFMFQWHLQFFLFMVCLFAHYSFRLMVFFKIDLQLCFIIHVYPACVPNTLITFDFLIITFALRIFFWYLCNYNFYLLWFYSWLLHSRIEHCPLFHIQHAEMWKALKTQKFFFLIHLMEKPNLNHDKAIYSLYFN